MKKRIPLSCGKITLHEKKYEIKKICGMGGSCIVYDAVHWDSVGNQHRVRIKELYPFGAVCTRNEDNSITGISEISKKRFWNASSVQMEFLSRTQTVNTTAGLWEVIEANQTCYQILEYYNGNPLAFDTLGNMEKYLSVMLQLSNILAEYHAAGYLHLDVKPDNIYYLPPQYDAIYTTGKILLLDFDSLVSESDIINGTAILSYSQDYAAPELKYSSEMQEITRKADFYSLGCMLFQAVIHRLPDALDCDMFAEWDFDRSDALFADMPEAFFEKLTDFFHQTLSSWADGRYETDEALISALEELHTLADVKKPYLESNISTAMNRYFVGRKTELQELQEKLSSEKHVFIQGVGGVGKSSLALNYASINKNNYDTILFAEYHGSFQELLEDDFAFPIGNMPEDNHSAEKKLSVFRELCSQSRVLLIIDNYDTDKKEQLYTDWLTLPCHIIITTRMKLSDSKKDTVILKGLAEAEELFYYYCSRSFSEEEHKHLITVFDEIDRHAMTVELLAKLFRDTEVSPEEVYQKIHKAHISKLPEDAVKNFKDDEFFYHSVNTHIDILFSLSGFTEEEVRTLQAVALLMDKALYKPRILTWFPALSESSLNHLIRRGWIQENTEFQLLSVHSLIFDRLMLHFPLKANKCEDLIQFMIDKLKSKGIPYSDEEVLYPPIENYEFCAKTEQYIQGSSKKLAELWFELSKLPFKYITMNGNPCYIRKLIDFYTSKNQKKIPYIVMVFYYYYRWEENFSQRPNPEDESSPFYIDILTYLLMIILHTSQYHFDEWALLEQLCKRMTWCFGRVQENCSVLFWIMKKICLRLFLSAKTTEEREYAKKVLYEFYEPQSNNSTMIKTRPYNPFSNQVKHQLYKYWDIYPMGELSAEEKTYETQLEILITLITKKKLLQAKRLAKKMTLQYLKTKETYTHIDPFFAALELNSQYRLLAAVYQKQNQPSELLELAKTYLKLKKYRNAYQVLTRAVTYYKQELSAMKPDDIFFIEKIYSLAEILLYKRAIPFRKAEKEAAEKELASVCSIITGQTETQKNDDLALFFLKTARKCIREKNLASAEKYLTCALVLWSADNLNLLKYTYINFLYIDVYKKIPEKSNLFNYYDCLNTANNENKNLNEMEIASAYLMAAEFASKVWGEEDIHVAKALEKAVENGDVVLSSGESIQKKINYRAITEKEEHVSYSDNLAKNGKEWISCMWNYANAENFEKAEEILNKFIKDLNDLYKTDKKTWGWSTKHLIDYYVYTCYLHQQHERLDKAKIAGKQALYYALKLWNLREETKFDPWTNYNLCMEIFKIYHRMEQICKKDFTEKKTIWLKNALKIAENEGDVSDMIHIYDELSKLDIPEKEYYQNKRIQLEQRHMS